MGAHRYQSAWRSITFNRVYDDSGIVDDPAHMVAAYQNSDYRLESLDPTSVQTVDYREMRQHLEGADPNQSFEGVRLIVGHGLIVGSDPADLEDKTWAMYEAFSPAACRMASLTTDPKGVIPFVFRRATAGGSKALLWYAKPAAGRPIVVGRVREGLNRRFMFQLVATDPFAYDATLTTTSLGPGGGTVTNPGSIYTRPKIEVSVSGAGSGTFTITNTTTGQSLVVSLVDPSGSNPIRTIDTSRATIVKADGTDMLSTLVSGFLTNMILVPGANAITFANTTNVTSVAFKFRGAYA